MRKLHANNGLRLPSWARRQPCGTFCMALVILTAPIAEPADAGRIVGRVTVAPRTASAPTLSPYAGRLGSHLGQDANGSTRGLDASSASEVAIYLNAPGTPPSGSKSDLPQMRQKNLRFEPRVLAIAVGTDVAFPNLDPVFHNVFSYSPARRFDLGRYAKGKSKTVTFHEPGLVKVFCDVHADMAAYILVVDADWVTQPNGGGEFVLDDVPAGTHALSFWHPDHGERQVLVEVGDGTTRVELSF